MANDGSNLTASILSAIKAAEQTIEKSSKEYKEQESNRRNSMSDEERRKEDLRKFVKRTSYL